jgi:hypothetical protein
MPASFAESTMDEIALSLNEAAGHLARRALPDSKMGEKEIFEWNA